MGECSEEEIKGKMRLKRDEECVVCLAAPATMQTFPCGHKVVCRKCLIKTIQVAISQRCLPLRCVICRDRILRLQHTTRPGAAVNKKELARAPVSITDPMTRGLGTPAGTPSSIEMLLVPPTSHSPSHSPASPGRLLSMMSCHRSQNVSPKHSITSPKHSITSPKHSITSPKHTLTKPQQQAPLPSPRPTPRLGPHHAKNTPQHPVHLHLQPGRPQLGEPGTHSPTSNLEAFVGSHNDALNMKSQHQQKQAGKVALSEKQEFKQPDRKSEGKAKKRQGVSGQRRHDSPYLSFRRSNLKVHPEQQDAQAFMGDPDFIAATKESKEVVKHSKANNFITKFLSRSSRRSKHTWQRLY